MAETIAPRAAQGRPAGPVGRRIRLAIVATHPVQYYAPLYRALARRAELAITVLFAHRPSPAEQGVGFGVPFAWDTDLTGGYPHVWMQEGPSALSEVGARIRRGDFDVVLVQGWNARVYWDAIRSCWARRLPVLVRGDSQLRDDAAIWKRLAKRAAYPLFVHRFAACVSVGTRSEAYFRYYGARRIVRSPHFVDNAAFAGGAAGARRSAREAWHIAPDDFVALFAGKLIARKRAPDLIRAMARARVPGAVLIAGDGAERRACERLGRTLGVRVVVAGFLNQRAIPRAYAAADVLVLPSARRETWGLVVNEAMACGVPALVSEAAGCVDDLIIPGETGECFPPGDVDRLAALLRAAATDRETLRRMGDAARAHVARFSAEAAAAGVVEAVVGAVA